MNYTLGPVLHNRFVLYFMLFLAIVEILYFMGTRDVASLVILSLVGFLTTFFNKNMIVVLFLALVVTNTLKYGVGSRLNEGFEGKKDDSNAIAEKENLDHNLDKKNDEKKDKDNEHKDGEKKNGDSKVTAEKVDEQYENLKEEYPKFKVVQQEILAGVQKMTPLLEKAEKFIDKFDAYKSNKVKESFSRHA
jgi:hypothetical protein